MNKKVSSLICFALIVILSVPIVSVVFAAKNSRGPPEKIVFIHHKKGYGKPQKEDKGDYKLLVRGAKWRDLPAVIIIDPRNSGLEVGFVVSAISASVDEWDYWTGAELFNDSYRVVDDGSWDSDAPDGRNELVFGDYDQEGVIAVCIVWGHFGGRPSQREIIEFDIIFDTDYTWGDAKLDFTVMDLQNIATHELGHGAGLGDLYKPRASEETMYGYSTEGEIKKRTLYLGDIAGIQKLYGE